MAMGLNWDLIWMVPILTVIGVAMRLFWIGRRDKKLFREASREVIVRALSNFQPSVGFRIFLAVSDPNSLISFYYQPAESEWPKQLGYLTTDLVGRLKENRGPGGRSIAVVNDDGEPLPEIEGDLERAIIHEADFARKVASGN